jgi:hypothetical protein
MYNEKHKRTFFMEDVVRKYVEKFEAGTKYVKIASPVIREHLTEVKGMEPEVFHLDCVKFVPASGAATRMFEDLYKYLEEEKETPYISTFFEKLELFPFYEDLALVMEKESLEKDRVKDRRRIIEYLLQDMKYGEYPKAFIKMNRYEGYSTMPIEEHLYEGEQYLNPENLRFHFTISPSHEDLLKSFKKSVEEKAQYVEITYSFQKPSTDTIAVNMDNTPFLLENGEYLYRPGGHGALIENLNDLDADVVFIKNIDNVCHRNFIEDTVVSKKELASIGYCVKKKIDDFIRKIKDKEADLKEIEEFIRSELKISYKGEMTLEKALEFLNRPLRVCGVVKNQGEPGGGPFVIDQGDYTDLQICEKAEINLADEAQADLFHKSEFFNPVDLVCFLKDYKGEKFDLLKYVNENRYFISKKSYKGTDIKALEHPGLWNGAMDKWNTIFVEVPLSTFNPVKKVNDLLSPGHRGEV